MSGCGRSSSHLVDLIVSSLNNLLSNDDNWLTYDGRRLISCLREFMYSSVLNKLHEYFFIRYAVAMTMLLFLQLTEWIKTEPAMLSAEVMKLKHWLQTSSLESRMTCWSESFH